MGIFIVISSGTKRNRDFCHLERSRERAIHALQHDQAMRGFRPDASGPLWAPTILIATARAKKRLQTIDTDVYHGTLWYLYLASQKGKETWIVKR